MLDNVQVSSKQNDKRRNKRLSITLPATAIQDGFEVNGIIENISEEGALFTLNPISSSCLRFHPIELDIPGIGRYPCVVIWRSMYWMGLQFLLGEAMQHAMAQRLNAYMRDHAGKSLPSVKPDVTPTQISLPEPQIVVTQPTDQTAEADQIMQDVNQPHRLPNGAEKRKDKRYSTKLYCHVQQDGLAIPCNIIDISLGGAQLQFDTLSARSVRNKTSTIDAPGLGPLPIDFKWRADTRAGVSFKFSRLQRSAFEARFRDIFVKPK